MSKRLIGILALVFVACAACAAYAEVQNVKVGGDFTTFAFTRTGFNLEKEANTGLDEAQGLAAIMNVKVAADLTDAVSMNVILRNERVWGGTASDTTGGSLDTYLAAAWATFKEFMQQPITLKVGQMPVKLGSGLIWGDPSTNQIAGSATAPFAIALEDLDPRVAFTGALMEYDLSPIKLTGGAFKITEGSLLNNQDDVNAYTLQAGYDITDLKGVGEVYWVFRDQAGEEAVSALGTTSDVNVYGLRTQLSPTDLLCVGGEVAFQQQKDIRDDNKWASDSAVLLNASMKLPDVVMAPSIGVDYTRLSQNWYRMWETLTPADIANALFPNSNVQAFGGTVGLKPMEDVSLKLRYAYLRAVKALSSGTLSDLTGDWASGGTWAMNTEKKDLGSEVDVHMFYDYTEDVQFGVKAGYFMPGKAFDGSNREDASQVIGSMKVSF